MGNAPVLPARPSITMTASVESPAEEVAPPPFDPVAFAKTLPGITDPLGFFDPAGFCSQEGVTEGKIRFYREVEIKHCRLAMLAALGFPLAEAFHPLFGGNIDVPSYLAFPETFSVFSFQSPAGNQPWSIRLDHAPGDLGFDPLGLKPSDPAELLAMQNKELNNGRLAMIAAA